MNSEIARNPYPELQKSINAILDIDLPPAKDLIEEARQIAESITPGRSMFMDRLGVDSEYEFKKQCMKSGKIMFHAHIGMNSWPATVDALSYIHDCAIKKEFSIQRFGLCLDRRMGLPKKFRKKVPSETGPMLSNLQQWKQITHTVPIQPHMGDFMIGFPNSTENTICALKVGVTTIGNLSQFFTHEVPMWRDRVKTTAETVRACALMGAFRQKGMLVHSYLEDGMAALFHDCATVAGWAFLERYIVENLLGAKLAHCIGGLTSDPVKRAGWVFALDEIHEKNCVGSMIYGDTISFSNDFTLNRALINEYLLWDIMTQMACPTGHAVVPLPVSEALRVPSAEEIVESQIFGNRIEKSARRLYPFVNFEESILFARNIVDAGNAIFTKTLESLSDACVDIRDPVKLLYLLKNLGPEKFEVFFGAGNPDDSYLRGRQLVCPTDVYELSTKAFVENQDLFLSANSRKELRNRRLLIASTDVHEFAISVISRLMSEGGANMIYLGAECDPYYVAQKAKRHLPDAILISTHNGMALDYAVRLNKELKKANLKIPVKMGGILNQKIEQQSLPVNVADKLKEINVLPFRGLKTDLRKLLE